VDAGETDPKNPDTDGGGVDDGTEVANGTDPLKSADDRASQPQPNNSPVVVETTLDGGAGGAINPLWLALLGLLGVIRRLMGKKD